MKHLNLALLLIGGLVFGGYAEQAVAQNRVVVKVANTNRPDQAFIELGFRRGYFSELGLDLQFVSGGASAQEYISALATNQIQVGAGSPNAGLINALNRGIDIRIVADWSHIAKDASDTTLSLIGRSDLMDSGALKSVADLRGKTVSLGQGIGSVNEMFFSKALDRAGLKRTDMNAITMGFSEALGAMRNQRLDAAVLIEPFVWTAQQQKIGRVLITAGEVDPGAQVAVLLYSPEFARNTDVATRFMVGYLKSTRDYTDAFVARKNPEAAVDILVANLPLKDRNVWLNAQPFNLDPNGRINVDHIRAQANFYKSTGSVTGNVPDFSKVVDPSFAEAASKQLGIR